MKKVDKHILFVFLVIALLAISTSVVFAKELGLLTISGPGIKGEVSLNDHEAMMNLEQSGFFDQAFLAQPPKDLAVAQGYNITAHLNLDGELVPYIQMVYYPTKEGQSAYIHYTARLEGDALQPINEWHLLNRKADGVLRDLFAANKITVQSTLVKAPEVVAPAKEPVSAAAEVQPLAPPAATSPAPAPVQPYLIPILVVGFLMLMGLALVVRRRNVSSTA